MLVNWVIKPYFYQQEVEPHVMQDFILMALQDSTISRLESKNPITILSKTKSLRKEGFFVPTG
ncbi:hypothetical protein OX88_24630 [Pseudomonas coronafaciens pv. porri]|nr:hypothetical protein OX88_24630 [Pseudomonas coronafaciens pv. porri]